MFSVEYGIISPSKLIRERKTYRQKERQCQTDKQIDGSIECQSKTGREREPKTRRETE